MREPIVRVRKLKGIRGRQEATLLKRAQAVDLRIKGYTYPQIAEAMTCDVATAYRYVRDVLVEVGRQAGEDGEQVRQIELARLDRCLKALDRRIEDGDPQAIDTSLRIAKRRAELLGLDAVRKLEVTGKDGTALLPLEAVRAVVTAATA